MTSILSFACGKKSFRICDSPCGSWYVFYRKKLFLLSVKLGVDRLDSHSRRKFFRQLSATLSHNLTHHLSKLLFEELFTIAPAIISTLPNDGSPGAVFDIA